MTDERPKLMPVDHSSADPAALLVETRFIPQRYEPNYAYPLLVLFHGRGGDEQQLAASMPRLSWRNYVAVSLRGPELLTRRGVPRGFGWGPDFGGPARRAAEAAEAAEASDRDCEPALTAGDFVRRRFSGEVVDPIDAIEDGVFSAIRRARRALHIHSERIFLMGVGEGASVAYRLGLTYPERFAGIVAINGRLPSGDGYRPLARVKDCRSLRILAVHGEWNARSSVIDARRDIGALRAGGLKVSFQSYPCAHRLTRPMLADVDTWLIQQCTNPED